MYPCTCVPVYLCTYVSYVPRGTYMQHPASNNRAGPLTATPFDKGQGCFLVAWTKLVTMLAGHTQCTSKVSENLQQLLDNPNVLLGFGGRNMSRLFLCKAIPVCLSRRKQTISWLYMHMRFCTFIVVSLIPLLRLAHTFALSQRTPRYSALLASLQQNSNGHRSAPPNLFYLLTGRGCIRSFYSTR